MLRFFLRLFLIMIVGAGVLSLVAPEVIGEFLFFVIALIGIAAVLKISLDFYLDRSKDEEDSKTDWLLREPEGKVYTDLNEYARELRRRDEKPRRGNSR